MLDELRQFDDEEEEHGNEEMFAPRESAEAKADKLFLGMTALERMFLSMFLFLTVFVLGLAFLVVTGRIVP